MIKKCPVCYRVLENDYGPGFSGFYCKACDMHYYIEVLTNDITDGEVWYGKLS
jgi:hypothetical protein